MTQHHIPLNDMNIKPTRILIVDDDEVDRENVRRILSTCSENSYDVITAENYQAAKQMLEEFSFDVCLLDYQLGGHTGLDLLNWLREENNDVSTILLTGFDDSAIDSVALNAGVSDFLCKNDVSPKALKRSIRYALHHKTLANEQSYLASHDGLTKLVNRSIFFDRLNHLVSQSQRFSREHAVLYVDVDYFKAVNDKFGHVVGDAVLRQFSDRLLSLIRNVDTAARLGGDEFGVILEEVDAANAHWLSQKIVREMNKPFMVEGVEVTLSASVGMALFPDDTLKPSEILKQADNALYMAKRSGRNKYRNYDKSLKSDSQISSVMERDFQKALDNSEIAPYFQPQLSLIDNSLVGFEALARWQHPELGFVSPLQFINHAEKYGMMSDLTRSIMWSACSHSDLMSHNGNLLKMAINISASECSNPRLVGVVERLLFEANMLPAQLELEVTESVLMKKPEASIRVLSEIHKMGVKIAIDDFGTGYSSLSYLAALPFDTLKIDRSFIEGIGISEKKEVVIKVIIDLANALKLETLAEGVETQAQANFLKDLGCQYVQGFLYSEALPANLCVGYLQQ